MPEYRKLKNRTRLSTTVKNEIFEELRKYSEETGVPITRVLDKAIDMYLKSVSKWQAFLFF